MGDVAGGQAGRFCEECGQFYLRAEFAERNKAQLKRRSTQSIGRICRFCKALRPISVKINSLPNDERLLEATAKLEELKKPIVAQKEAAILKAAEWAAERVRKEAAPAKKWKARKQVKVLAAGKGKLRIVCPYKQHEGQAPVHASLARFRTVAASVRGGKTECGVYEIAEKALGTKDGHFWIVAPTYKMLDVTERAFKLLLRRTEESLGPAVKLFNYEKKDRRYRVPSGSIVECRSAEWPDQLRGPGLNGALIDESAYIKQAAMHVMRSRVSDRLGWLLCISSPKGKNWFYRWHARGKSDKYPEYESFHWTALVNPAFPNEEWEAARRDLPADVFAQDYEAKFLDDVAGVFRGVDRIVAEKPIDKAEGPLQLGIDWAKTQDWTVMTVMGTDGNVVDFRRFNDLSWVIQKREAIRLAKAYDAEIWHDSTGVGDPLHDELVEELGGAQVHGIKFHSSSIRHLIQGLQSAVEQREILIPDHPVLRDEMQWFEYHRLPSGHLKYEAPSGFSDDCVFSLALANWGRLQRAATGEAVVIDRPADFSNPGQAMAAGTDGGSVLSNRLWGDRRERIF